MPYLNEHPIENANQKGLHIIFKYKLPAECPRSKHQKMRHFVKIAMPFQTTTNHTPTNTSGRDRTQQKYHPRNKKRRIFIRQQCNKPLFDFHSVSIIVALRLRFVSAKLQVVNEFEKFFNESSIGFYGTNKLSSHGV